MLGVWSIVLLCAWLEGSKRYGILTMLFPLDTCLMVLLSISYSYVIHSCLLLFRYEMLPSNFPSRLFPYFDTRSTFHLNFLKERIPLALLLVL